MITKEEKIPKWKEKEERMRKSSFDQALEQLGVNKRFKQEKKDSKEETKKEDAVLEK